ncbi:hypothetical protein DXG01_013092, partial [Tephrocybe rancida]
TLCEEIQDEDLQRFTLYSQKIRVFAMTATAIFEKVDLRILQLFDDARHTFPSLTNSGDGRGSRHFRQSYERPAIH